MIISSDAEEAFDKTQHPFMVRVTKDLASIIKAMHSKPLSQTKLMERSVNNSTKTRGKARLSAPYLSN